MADLESHIHSLMSKFFAVAMLAQFALASTGENFLRDFKHLNDQKHDEQYLDENFVEHLGTPYLEDIQAGLGEYG